MKLIVLKPTLAIVRLYPDHNIPQWSLQGEFFAITKTMDELSVVCEQHLIPSDIDCNGDWRAFKVMGPLDFSLTGILSMLAAPLATAQISIFAISTYDTDYILVKAAQLEAAITALTQAGHYVV